MIPPRSEVALRFESDDHRAAFMEQADAMVQVRGPLEGAAVEVVGDDVVVAVETDDGRAAARRAVAVARAVCEGSDVPVPAVGGWSDWTPDP